MTLINIRNLGVTLSAPLFSQLNLAVNAGDRIGLVAANGRGKSTLLRCMAGAMEASGGEISRSRGLTVGYVEQHVPEVLMDRPFYGAVLEMLSPDQQRSEHWRVDVALESAAEAAETFERRLAAPCHACPRAGDRAGRAAARRADQPPRSRPDRPVRRLAERAAAGHARRHIQPRPRLPRRDHEPNPVPAAGRVAGVLHALYPGARRIA